jgi:hypothetical protein
MLGAKPIVRRVVALTCILVVMPACDPTNFVLERLGLLRTDEGIAVRFVLCPGELVTAISVRESGSDPNDVLWQIESRGESESEFIVGRRPTGFTETKSLESPLSSSRTYVISVDTSKQNIASETFMLGDLRADEVQAAWKDEYMTPSQFEERGRDLCG